MIIEHLENFYRAQAESLAAEPRDVFRASSAGYCVRRLGYDKLGIRGRPLTPRRLAVFRHGTMIDQALKRDLEHALKDKFLNLDRLGGNVWHLEEGGEDIWISFHPDGAYQDENGDIGIIEIKTMADYSFERALKGEIDHAYLCQAWVYAVGTSFNPVRFLCYRKETSHFVEVVFDRRATETIVTQRFGGDLVKLATDEPLLLAEVRTPFDPSVEAEVRAKFIHLSHVHSEADLAQGVNIVEDELVKVQGKEKAVEAAAQYGVGEQKGSWWTFKTGRKIAGFPCSYCPYVERCLGAQLEVEGGKPLWVIPKSRELAA